MLKELTVKKFIEELSSNAPVPGGGSVAALSAALAAALGSMVFNLTINKKAFNELEDEVKSEILDALESSSQYVEEFLELMEKDAEVFSELIDAFKMPKDNDEQIAERKKKIDLGYKLALEVPRELALKAEKLYSILQLSAIYGNINAISDSGVGAIMLHGAIESAILNIKINLNSVKEEEQREKLIKECNDLYNNSVINKEKVLKAVNEKL